MVAMLIGMGIGVFISWTSFMIGMERQAYVEAKKDDLYKEILNERNYYKRYYEREFHKYNSGH